MREYGRWAAGCCCWAGCLWQSLGWHLLQGACCAAPQAALQHKSSLERLLLVAAFAVSGFQAVGALKCTMPTMGETYEVGQITQRLKCKGAAAGYGCAFGCSIMHNVPSRNIAIDNDCLLTVHGCGVQLVLPEKKMRFLTETVCRMSLAINPRLRTCMQYSPQ